MGQDIGTAIVNLTGGEGLGLGLEPIQSQALPWLLFMPIPCQVRINKPSPGPTLDTQVNDFRPTLSMALPHPYCQP